MHDGIIIGGGVIGLALAWELSRRGQRLMVLDKQEIGREASWAGAGILPAAGFAGSEHPLEQLRAMAHALHPEWSTRLRQETGIDTGYKQSGGIYLARTPGETAALIAQLAEWKLDGVECLELTHPQLAELEPALLPLIESGQLRTAAILPTEGQLRNPRYLKALRAGCEINGVEFLPNTEVVDINYSHRHQVTVVAADASRHTARWCCVCGGAWTVELLKQLGQPSGILPIRGQMLLYKLDRPVLSRVVNEGTRYLVPRDDGHLLVGSCEEEAGFEKVTSPHELAELQAFAETILPVLRGQPIVQSWAGLRPGSFDTFPYMGKLPGSENVFVSAGHFRSGLSLSPAVSEVMADLILSCRTAVDLQPFRVSRG